MLRTAFLALAAGTLLTAPALAQPAGPPIPPVPTPPTPTPDAAPAVSDRPDPNDQSDTFTIGVGGAVIADFEGSDDYKLIPAAAIRGRFHRISFTTRATFLYVDFIPRSAGHLSFNAGPIAGVRFNRTGHVKDPIVNLLPRRNKAFEVGGFAGVTYNGLTNPYDALSLRVDVVHDIGNAHRSTIVSPALDFSTPLSHTTYVGLSTGLDFVTSRYARYYFGIEPGDSGLSGLPVYSPGGGLKDWKVGLLVNQSITGNLLHGLSLFGTGSYSRLLGDFKRSPIVAQRGSASQWLGAIGLAYTF
ncbi:MAG: MipA/OmpV family protein [Sphingomicrobium sp.]|nr:MipA/OmpV family protein [Sphingomonadales bacterium]